MRQSCIAASPSPPRVAIEARGMDTSSRRQHAGPRDRPRPGRGRTAGAHRRVEVRRSPALVSSGRDLRPRGRQPGNLDPVRLGRRHGGGTQTPGRRAGGRCLRRRHTLRRRHPGAGIGAGHGQDQDRAVVDPRLREGRLYVRDERPFAGSRAPAALFFYSPDRKSLPSRKRGASTPRRICRTSRGSATPTAMPGSTGYSPATGSLRPPAGPMSAANSSTSMPPMARRSPNRPSTASAISTEWKRRSPAGRPTRGALNARNDQSQWLPRWAPGPRRV